MNNSPKSIRLAILKVLCLMTLAFSSPNMFAKEKPIDSFKLHNITFEILDEGHCAVSHAGNKIEAQRPGLSAMYSFFILEDYRFTTKVIDGTIESGENIIVIDKLNDIRKLKLPLFAFFSKKPTTCGFIFATAGASGGGTQKLAFFDTVSNKSLIVSTSDLAFPQWQNDGQYPPNYLEQVPIWLGSHNFSTGWGDRIHRCFKFEGDQYQRDSERERNLFLKHYLRSKLTLKEWRQVREYCQKLQQKQNVWLEPNLAGKLVDYLYYAKRIGKQRFAISYVRHFTLGFFKGECLSLLNRSWK